MTSDKGWEEAELDLMLSQILEMRFGDGTGENLQVSLALKEIKQLIRNLKHKWQAEAWVDGFMETGEGYNAGYLRSAKDRNNVTREDAERLYQEKLEEGEE